MYTSGFFPPSIKGNFLFASLYDFALSKWGQQSFLEELSHIEKGGIN